MRLSICFLRPIFKNFRNDPEVTHNGNKRVFRRASYNIAENAKITLSDIIIFKKFYGVIYGVIYRVIYQVIYRVDKMTHITYFLKKYF